MLPLSTARVPKAKNQKEAIKMLPGYVAKVRIRCGKSSCRCARGERHIAFYHVRKHNGARSRRYIRKAEVEQIRLACQAHKQQQAELARGRRECSLLIKLAKLMFRDMAGS